jgi:alpha-beta hydrolase superfamily lysophospholipase
MATRLSRAFGPKTIVTVTAIALGVGALTAYAMTKIAAVVVTPPRRPREDQVIVSVADDLSTITLATSPDAKVPGNYSFWFSLDAGHLRLGEIVSEDDTTVTRRIDRVSFGELRGAKHGRISGWYYLGPEELGFPVESVAIATDRGEAPAWIIRAPRGTKRWAIHVHGRGTQRQETLRAVPTFREHGYTSLLVSYRNDGDAPDSEDGRYGLGSTEWRDVDAALRFALEKGASEVVLVGWSMGGAIVLQTVTRSSRASAVKGIMLESPVVDWVPTLEYQGEMLRVPGVVTRGAMRVLDASWGGRFTGQSAPVGLASLDFVARADELTRPMLVLHSDDDGFVPPTASRELAERRPDIVTFVPFTVARHTKLWNYDADTWTAAIADWLETSLGSKKRGVKKSKPDSDAGTDAPQQPSD